ncbi:hypothetical protein J2S74_000820 [Evansella vedderi]|uniref:Uncharacterized protein n=1 Tax=Evansella vedderi TaxID=38282 RepID=A0ABT9ZSJ3_9BACI|nr:hypothetical protein [Evansella vedderi]MDQ0253448.1 hypothetical protein [Evansella vedderi]
MKNIIVGFLLLLTLLQSSNTYAHDADPKITFLVKSSSTSVFQTTLTVESRDLTNNILHYELGKKVSVLPIAGNYILLEENGGMVRSFLMDEMGNFYDLEKKQVVNFSPETVKKIRGYFKGLHGNHFGELVEWETGETLLPRYSEFKVTDLETGLSFNAQRRAGSNHADVQPLTKEDTAIMKEIYDGTWSWKRRAVVVHFEEEHIAASMHGMPHGAGALANGFPGHFCIHLMGSRTHTTGKEDLSHQVMVHKAGGELTEFVRGLEAEEVAKLFFIALNQNDMDLFQQIYVGDAQEFRPIVESVESVRILEHSSPSAEGSFVYEAPVTYIVKQQGRPEINDVFTLEIVRESLMSPWKLVNVPFNNW